MPALELGRVLCMGEMARQVEIRDVIVGEGVRCGWRGGGLERGRKVRVADYSWTVFRRACPLRFVDRTIRLLIDCTVM